MRADATLNQLKAYFGSDHLPSSYEVYFKNTLVALCHALEDHILQQEGDSLVIATFQQGKWYQQEAKRYAQIVQKSGKVVIASTFDSGFASISSDDTSNVSLVEFANDNVLTNEWNLIIIDTNYAAAVLTYELLPAEYNDETIAKIDTERKFYGLWTFDRAIVDKSASILIDNFAKLDSSLAQEVAHYQQQINQNY
jgi:DICT domain-containing protein